MMKAVGPKNQDAMIPKARLVPLSNLGQEPFCSASATAALRELGQAQPIVG